MESSLTGVKMLFNLIIKFKFIIVSEFIEAKVLIFVTYVDFFFLNRSLRSNEIKFLEIGMFSQRSNLTYL